MAQIHRVTEYINQEGEIERLFYTRSNTTKTLPGHNHPMVLIAEQSAAGGLTIHKLNEKQQVEETVDPLGRATLFFYDRWGNHKNVIDPAGNTSTEVRNQFNELRYIADASGAKYNIEHNTQGRMSEFRGPEGLAYSYAYDANGNLTQVREGEPPIEPDAMASYLGYKQLSDKRPTTRFTYDRYNRLTSRTDPDGSVHRFKHDVFGNLLRLTYPDGSLSTFEYNTANQMTKARLCDGRELHWQYDVRGNLLAQTDGEGRTTSYKYGPYDLLQEVLNPKGDAVRLSYDGAIRLNTVTNAAGEVYRFDRDGGGRVVAETDFGGKTIQFAYDAASQLTHRTDNIGTKTEYSYDPLGQPIGAKAETADGQSSVQTFERDAMGRITAATNAAGTIQLEYDQLGRVTREAFNGVETSIQHSLKGRTSISLLGLDDQPHSLNQGFDIMGRQASLQIPGHEAVQWLYDKRGNSIATRFSADTFLAQQFSRVNELTGQRLIRGEGAGTAAKQFSQGQALPFQPGTGRGATLAAARDYGYDRTGTPQAISDLLNGSTQYSQDANGQVTQAHHRTPGGELVERFAYGPTLDITGSGSGPDVPGRVGDGQDHLRGITPWQRRKGGALKARGERLFQVFDDAGRVIERVEQKPGFRPTRTFFKWNTLDQLTHVTITRNNQVMDKWRYEYDAFGRRIAKHCDCLNGREMETDVIPSLTRDGGNGSNDNSPKYRVRLEQKATSKKTQRILRSARFVWNRNSMVAEVKTYADGSVAEVLWHYKDDSPFTPFAREEAGEVSYVVTDHLGTPKELVNAAGDVLWHGTQKLWGERLYGTADNDNHLMLFRFQGQQHDAETGLYYNRFRYYDSSSGTYLSNDPIRLNGGLRLSEYVPDGRTAIDPLGLEPCGRRGNPLVNSPIQPVRNTPAVIGGRQYTGHALDQMQNRGLVPSVVENALNPSNLVGPGNTPGTSVYQDVVNKIKVIINDAGDVVTVIPQ